MTTNQTIDGVLVPRELAKRLAVPMLRTPEYLFDHRDALDELRALLEAPAAQWLAMEVNGKPWVIKEGANADKWRALGYELLPVEPAAQPQGEPVAEVYRGPVSGISRIRWIDYRTAPVGTKLYAEQPAPVAVVLPERLAMTGRGLMDAPTVNHHIGWNACLDELKRLNPSL